MKASDIRYVRPRSLEQTYEILSNHEGAVPLAGGQSLMVALNMRLSAPELVVDIGDLAELSYIIRDGDTVSVGALTRHYEILESDILRDAVPLLPSAAHHIAHTGIRNRGTIGGSLAYADPAAELPACSVALDATIVIGSSSGVRSVKAEDFFKGLFETDLRPGELIVGVKFPVFASHTVFAFEELARRHGDFAIAGLAAVSQISDAKIKSARFVYFGCTNYPKVARNISDAVTGLASPTAFAGEIGTVVAKDIAPDDTPGMRGETKRHLATVLTKRVLNQLLQVENHDVVH